MGSDFQFKSAFQATQHAYASEYESEQRLDYESKQKLSGHFYKVITGKEVSTDKVGLSWFQPLQNLWNRFTALFTSEVSIKELRHSLIDGQVKNYRKSIEGLVSRINSERPLSSFEKLIVTDYCVRHVHHKEVMNFKALQKHLGDYGCKVALSQNNQNAIEEAFQNLLREGEHFVKACDTRLTSLAKEVLSPSSIPTNQALFETKEQNQERAALLQLTDKAFQEAFASQLDASASASLPDLIKLAIQKDQNQLLKFMIDQHPDKIFTRDSVIKDLLNQALEGKKGRAVNMLIQAAKNQIKENPTLPQTVRSILVDLAKSQQWLQVGMLCHAGLVENLGFSPYAIVFSPSYTTELNVSRMLCRFLLQEGILLPDGELAEVFGKPGTGTKEMRLVSYCVSDRGAIDGIRPLTVRELVAAKACGALEVLDPVLRSSLDGKRYFNLGDPDKLKEKISNDPLASAYLEYRQDARKLGDYVDMVNVYRWSPNVNLNGLSNQEKANLGKGLAIALSKLTTMDSLLRAENPSLKSQKNWVERFIKFGLGSSPDPVLNNAFISTFNDCQIRTLANSQTSPDLCCTVNSRGDCLLFAHKNQDSLNQAATFELLKSKGQTYIEAYRLNRLSPQVTLNFLQGISKANISGIETQFHNFLSSFFNAAIERRDFASASQVMVLAVQHGYNWQSSDFVALGQLEGQDALDWNEAILKSFSAALGPSGELGRSFKLRCLSDSSSALAVVPRSGWFGSPWGSALKTQQELMAILEANNSTRNYEVLKDHIELLLDSDKNLKEGWQLKADRSSLVDQTRVSLLRQKIYLRQFDNSLQSGDFRKAAEAYCHALFLPCNAQELEGVREKLKSRIKNLEPKEKKLWNQQLIFVFSEIKSKEPELYSKFNLGSSKGTGTLGLYLSNSRSNNSLIESLVQSNLLAPLSERKANFDFIKGLILDPNLVKSKPSGQVKLLFSVLEQELKSMLDSANDYSDDQKLAAVEVASSYLAWLKDNFKPGRSRSKLEDSLDPIMKALRASCQNILSEKNAIQNEVSHIGREYAKLLVFHWNEKHLSPSAKAKLSSKRQTMIRELNDVLQKAEKLCEKASNVEEFQSVKRLCEQLKGALELDASNVQVPPHLESLYSEIVKDSSIATDKLELQRRISQMSKQELTEALFYCVRKAMITGDCLSMSSSDVGAVLINYASNNLDKFQQDCRRIILQEDRALEADLCFAQLAVIAKKDFNKSKEYLLNNLSEKSERLKKGLDDAIDRMSVISEGLGVGQAELKEFKAKCQPIKDWNWFEELLKKKNFQNLDQVKAAIKEALNGYQKLYYDALLAWNKVIGPKLENTNDELREKIYKRIIADQPMYTTEEPDPWRRIFNYFSSPACLEGPFDEMKYLLQWKYRLSHLKEGEVGVSLSGVTDSALEVADQEDVGIGANEAALATGTVQAQPVLAQKDLRLQERLFSTCAQEALLDPHMVSDTAISA